MLKSKRTGGPRTEAGKLAASKNATKMGVYSQSYILPDENEQDFNDLYAQYMLDFSPQDVAESAMVHDLVVITWKKLRLQRLQHGKLLSDLKQPIQMYELYQYKIELKEGCEWLLEDLSIVTNDYIKNFVAIFKFYQKMPAKKLTEAQIESLANDCPACVPEIFKLAHEFFDYNEADVTFLQLCRLQSIKFGAGEFFVNDAMPRLYEKSLQVVSVAKQINALRAAVKSIKEGRLIRSIAVEDLSRPTEDLNRQFFRALGELRRQQKWRKEMRVVDVEQVME
jgi:hypothetical protein